MENLMKSHEDEWGIGRLQNCILNIMKYIDEFCQKNGINYCLMGGSALGAVRHKGFIPWDDDMDIFMRPNDYNHFRSLFEQKGDKDNFYLQEWGEEKGMITLAKLRYNNSEYIENDLKDWNINQGVFVDIFILHTCPNGCLNRLRQYCWAKYLVAKGVANRKNSKSGLMGVVVGFLSLLPKRFLLRHALHEIYRYEDDETDFYCHFLGHAGLKAGLYKRNYFGGVRRVPFESTMLNVPDKVEEYLHDRWGNYMKLPSKEEIGHSQHTSQWEVGEPFKGYNKQGKYLDEKYLLT